MSRAVAAFKASRNVSAIMILPILLLLLVAVMVLVEPRFFGTQNFFNILRNTSFLAILALGQAIVIAVGGLDLSVGAVAAFAGIIAAKAMAALAVAVPDLPMLAILGGAGAGILAGAAIGLANGLCVALLGVSPLVVTLGMLSIVSGIALLITSGLPVYGLPDPFVVGFGRAFWFGMPSMVSVALVILAIGFFVQQRMVVARHLLAVGGNAHAARVSGLGVNKHLISSYVLCSMLAALTGILLTAQIGSGQANLGGDKLMLMSIAAAIIGGVRLTGGVGRVEGVALSALFLSAVANALNLLRVDSKKELVVLGVVLILAVVADELMKGRSGRV